MKNIPRFNFLTNKFRNGLKNVVWLVVLSSFFSINFYSCKKTGPADALINVVDSSGKAIRGATVILKQDTVVNTSTGVKADIYQEKITDSEGNAFFSFKWEAVLNVEVTKGTQTETDYIRLEQSNTVEKQVILK